MYFRSGKKTPLFCGAILVLIYLVACGSPERDNPYDPASPHYRGTVLLKGTVLRFYPPFAPISGATVTLLPDSLSTRTGADGHFVFRAVKPGTYHIAAFRAGFSSDTLQWEVRLWQPGTPVLHLDALPQFEQVSVRTRHISRWWPPDDLYFLEIQIQLNDADGPGDVEGAFFSFPDIALYDTLAPGENTGEYSKRIEQKHLPGGRLQELIGSPLFLYARDRAGFVSRSGPHYLTRIIEELATPDSPKGLQTAPPRPTLRWIRSKGQYTFTYTADIYRDDGGVVTQVWRLAGIPATDDSVQVSQALPTGVYFWTVSVVDRFGNVGRSKEAAFRIE